MKGKKHGWGRFYHLDSGQLQEGYWEKGSAVTSFMEDLRYRQSSVEPTPYPIPPHKLKPCTPCYLFLKQAKDKLLQYNEGCQFHKYCFPKDKN